MGGVFSRAVAEHVLIGRLLVRYFLPPSSCRLSTEASVIWVESG